jgi:propionate CoA-transferase
MKMITATEAASLIEDNWTITTGGFGSCGHPEEITAAIEARFRSEGSPRQLDLLFAAGQGDRAGRGLNRLAHPDLVRRAIGGFWGLVPALGDLVRRNLIEAHNWPQGVISHLFRATAAGQPGIITKVGLRTFIDPDGGGGCLNGVTGQTLIRKLRLDGEDYLFYPRIPIHCAIIRGTRADTRGNITMEREVSFQDGLAQAQAAHNCGGIVIAQVSEVVPAGTLPPQQVKVPGILVDYIVVARAEYHSQTYGEAYNPAYAEAGLPEIAPASTPAVRRIIARRALRELEGRQGAVVNLGIGIPAEIGAEAFAAQVRDFTLTVESGPVGGVPATGLSFGAVANPEAVIDQSCQFDFYDGGGIDMAFLGFAQVDSTGNVNVSRFRGGMPGVGGFVNISQAAKRVVFCGSFTAGPADIRVDGGRLRIHRDGEVRKFVSSVEQVSFSGAYASECGRDITYVTERAVFKLSRGVLRLVELAPGIDLYRDVIERMDAAVIIDSDIREMDGGIFS